MSSRDQLWRFENAPAPGQAHQGRDTLYVPRVGYITGDLDIHTLFSCPATVSERYSFVPPWRPPLVSKLAAEDRCHLNGPAMEDRRPRYVTAVSRTFSGLALAAGLGGGDAEARFGLMAIGLVSDEIRRTTSAGGPEDAA